MSSTFRNRSVPPRLLDLFCGAGGAAMGYHRVGFEVVGVDNRPQPNYPFAFFQADALALPESPADLAEEFEAVHASCPCQAYTRAKRLQDNEHPDLIERTRELLQETGLPYVIENVPGAPLIEPVALEGQLFPGLRTVRRRLFETNWDLVQPVLPPRPKQVKMGRPPTNGEWIQVVGNFSDVQAGRDAMGIDWMTRSELSQAIPPAYTEFIGKQLMEVVRAPRAELSSV